MAMRGLCSLLCGLLMLPVAVVTLAVLLVLLVIAVILACFCGCLGFIFKPLDKDLANYLYHLPYRGLKKSPKSPPPPPAAAADAEAAAAEAAAAEAADAAAGGDCSQRKPSAERHSTSGADYAVPVSTTEAVVSPDTGAATAATAAAEATGEDHKSSSTGVCIPQYQSAPRSSSPVAREACEAV